MKKIILISLFLFGFVSFANAYDGKCYSKFYDLNLTQEHISELEKTNQVKRLLELKDDNAKSWISLMNQVPPVTYYEGDTVIVLSSIRTDYLLFAIFKDGCEVSRGQLRPDIYEEINKKYLGDFI